MPDTPNDTLRKAITAAGFQGAMDFARRHNLEANYSLIRAHLNGNKPITAAWADRYHRLLGVERNVLLGWDVDEDAVVDFSSSEEAALGVWYEGGRSSGQTKLLRGVAPRHAVGHGMRRAVQVKDGSVNRKIKEGDYAVYVPLSDKEIAELTDGYVYVARERDGGNLIERTIRKVVRRGSKLDLVTDSTDTRYTSTITYPSSRADETVVILGRVTGYFGTL